jgi:hypothetical protein
MATPRPPPEPIPWMARLNRLDQFRARRAKTASHDGLPSILNVLSRQRIRESQTRPLFHSTPPWLSDVVAVGSRRESSDAQLMLTSLSTLPNR